MAKEDYIEYSKKERFNEELEYMSKFNLSSHNIKRFEDKIDAIVTSIDTEIRSSMAYVDELQSAIKEQSEKPDVKGLVDDPWFKISKLQNNLIKYQIRAGAFKSWMIKFLIISNNKLSEFLDSINENLIELKKVEMQADMYKQMYQNLEEIRKTQNSQQTYFTGKEYEEQLSNLKSQISGQNNAVSSISQQLASLSKMISDISVKEEIIKNSSIPSEKTEDKPTPKTSKQPLEEKEIIDEESDEESNDSFEEDESEQDDSESDSESSMDDNIEQDEEDFAGEGAIKKKQALG